MFTKVARQPGYGYLLLLPFNRIHYYILFILDTSNQLSTSEVSKERKKSKDILFRRQNKYTVITKNIHTYE